MEEPVYQCPGERDPISPAVHRARLAAGWQGCQDCTWNERSVDTEKNSHSADVPVGLGSTTSRAVIRRSTYGVRGTYLNAMDRRAASFMASVFASVLAEAEFDRQQQATDDDRQVSLASAAQIVVGYDVHPQSPDLFAGVVPAVRRTGCEVLDVGCCTAASLHAAVKRVRFNGAILVTGAHSETGELGLDAFDESGQPLNVVWQKYGIRHRLKQSQQKSGMALSETAAQRFAETLRQTDESGPQGKLELDHHSQQGELLLPSDHQQWDAGRGRLRHSGSLKSESLETAYREQLAGWWPKSDSSTHSRPGRHGGLRILCMNELVIDRLLWLSDQTGLPLDLHEQRSSPEVLEDAFHHGDLVVEIDNDDRLMSMWSPEGRLLESRVLVEWLNARLSRHRRHVTAHVTGLDNLIQLLDVAGPDSSETYAPTTDALAVLGLFIQLSGEGKQSLPR